MTETDTFENGPIGQPSAPVTQSPGADGAIPSTKTASEHFGFAASPLPAGQRLEAYRTLFKGSSGQQVILDLLDRFGFLSRPTLGPDPQTTAYHEGQRSVVMAILRNAGVAPQAFPQVVSDHVTSQYKDLYGAHDGLN